MYRVNEAVSNVYETPLLFLRIASARVTSKACKRRAKLLNLDVLSASEGAFSCVIWQYAEIDTE